VSLAFGQTARDQGIAVSMGSKGDCYDNAVAESFLATLKKELVNRSSWPTREELRAAVGAITVSSPHLITGIPHLARA
jgi:putative transposase